MRELTGSVLGILVNSDRPLAAREIVDRIDLRFLRDGPTVSSVVASVAELVARHLLSRRRARRRDRYRYVVTTSGRRAWLDLQPRGFVRDSTGTGT